MTRAIGVDIGGTKVSAAYVADQEIVSTVTLDYNRQTLIENVSELYRNLISSHGEVEKLGISCAGLIDKSNGVVKFAGNLDMANFPLIEELSAKLDLPISLDNDARCALWGEYQVNKAQLGENVAGIIMGTGVGGGIIINQTLLTGVNGFAGELGHMKVSFSNQNCACGLLGCLEAEAGGRSFEHQFHAHSGKVLTAKEIAQAAKMLDTDALMAFNRLGNAVGEVVAQLDNALDLDSVVIGGGFGATLDIWQDTAIRTYSENLVGASNRKPIRFIAATLGNSAGLLGAALLQS